MKVLFKQIEFGNAVSQKMFSDMAKKHERISLDDFSRQTGVSKATLSRISRGGMPEIENFLKLCKWMNKKPTEFFN